MIFLSIIIENTKQNHVVCENEKFVSSKADKHNHGFGVENIKMAVEKYNGIAGIDYTDTIFTLAISIPLLMNKNKQIIYEVCEQNMNEREVQSH